MDVPYFGATAKAAGAGGSEVGRALAPAAPRVYAYAPLATPSPEFRKEYGENCA
jgi:hypothetical protein